METFQQSSHDRRGLDLITYVHAEFAAILDHVTSSQLGRLVPAPGVPHVTSGQLSEVSGEPGESVGVDRKLALVRPEAGPEARKLRNLNVGRGGDQGPFGQGQDGPAGRLEQGRVEAYRLAQHELGEGHLSVEDPQQLSRSGRAPEDHQTPHRPATRTLQLGLGTEEEDAEVSVQKKKKIQRRRRRRKACEEEV